MPKLKGAERRKVRKQRRKDKDRRSLKERRLNDRQIDALARLILKQPQEPVKEANGHYFCLVCELPYCVGFDGKSVFCHECWYIEHFSDACTKKMEGLKTCKECGGAYV